MWTTNDNLRRRWALMVVSALPLVEFYLGLEKMTKSVSNLEKTIFAFARESQIRIMGESKCER